MTIVVQAVRNHLRRTPGAVSKTKLHNTAILHHGLSQNESIDTSAPKLSGLQKQVLGLYRKLLRTSHSKQQQSSRTPFPESLVDPKSTVFAIKSKFREKASSVSRRDVDRIEYYIRQGEKYVKTLDMYGVKSMRTV